MTLGSIHNALLSLAAMIMLLPGVSNAAPDGHADPDAFHTGPDIQELSEPPCESSTQTTNNQDTCNTDGLCTPPGLVADNQVQVQQHISEEAGNWLVSFQTVYISPDPRPPCMG
jgi:hypothetical protein